MSELINATADSANDPYIVDGGFNLKKYKKYFIVYIRRKRL